MNDDVVFADRFRYPLTMFGNRVLIGISQLLHADIAYEIDTAKKIAACCPISYCLHDLVRLNSINCRVQTTRRMMVLFPLFDSVIHCIWNRYCQNRRSMLPNFPIVCMIWNSWIQRSAMFKQKDVRWYPFRWSIPISIDNVCRVCIDMAISTPIYSYYGRNSHIKNHHC